MSKQLIFKLLLTITCFSASLPPKTTLRDAISSNSSFHGSQIRALGSIASSHPELEDYELVDIYDDSAPNATESDYFVTMKNGGTAILAAVSFHANLSSFFVSFTKLPNNSHYGPLPFNSSDLDNETDESTWTTIPPPPPPPQNSPPPPPPQNAPPLALPGISPPPYNQTGARVLGGYQPLPPPTDSKLFIAQSYLHKLHPNLINYKLQLVEYQVVTGINYLFSYSGLDQFTNLTAKVYVGLDGLPRLSAFIVACAVISPECNSKIAGSVFNGTEQVLVVHPQLLSYRLVSIDIEEPGQNSLAFMVTFQNDKLKMRAIAEVKVAKTTEILSFYSYGYS